MMMGRPFRAWEFLRTNTWGVAPGWVVSGPLALRPVIANPSPNNAGSWALVNALETQLAPFRATAANLLTALVAELTSASANGAFHPSLAACRTSGGPEVRQAARNTKIRPFQVEWLT